MTDEQIDKLRAKIILSTKRRSRQYSVIEIAEDLETLIKIKGSKKQVGKIIDLSPSMIDKFLSVFRLQTEIIDYIKNREIDQVSMVYYLSKFDKKDSLDLLPYILNKQLSTQDLRVLIPYRKSHENDSITDIINNLKKTKNIKVSVIRVHNDDTHKNIDVLYETFKQLVGSENVFEIVPNKDFIDIKISKSGEKILREKAKKEHLTFQRIINSLIS